MSEYAQRFAENGINVAALPHLTDQDLKDIGVLLGHRRIMLAAIARLDVTSAVAASVAVAVSAPQPIAVATSSAARLGCRHVDRPRRVRFADRRRQSKR
jgi:hypothetical protein